MHFSLLLVVLFYLKLIEANPTAAYQLNYPNSYQETTLPPPPAITAPNYYVQQAPQQRYFNYQTFVNEPEHSNLSKYELEKKFRIYILYNLLRGQPCKERIAHPNNPNKFIICLDDGDYVIMDCPGNLVYNKYSDRCDYTLEMPQSPCLSNPCKYGGRCRDLSNYEYMCECTYGYSGKDCDAGSPDYCLNNPCGPNGVCNLLPATSPVKYYCSCFNGNFFGGSSCDYTQSLEYNPCNQAPDGLHPTRLSPNLYVHCDGTRLYVKMCSQPLIFAPQTGNCEWTAQTDSNEPTNAPPTQTTLASVQSAALPYYQNYY